MLNLRKEDSKIYTLGSLISGIGCIVSVILFWIYKGSTTILSIAWAFVSLSWIIAGTRSIFAKKDKWGYVNYFFAIIAIIFLVHIKN